jgi:hypothetical protein
MKYSEGQTAASNVSQYGGSAGTSFGTSATNGSTSQSTGGGIDYSHLNLFNLFPQGGN